MIKLTFIREYFMFQFIRIQGAENECSFNPFETRLFCNQRVLSINFQTYNMCIAKLFREDLETRKRI